jgi:hypothetical protein
MAFWKSLSLLDQFETTLTSYTVTARNVSHPKRNQIASPELAVDGTIEEY